MTSNHHHLLLICIPAWGHSRPGLAYAIKLLQETTNLTITFPITKDWTQNIDDEIAKYVPDVCDPMRDRLKIIQIYEKEQSEIPVFGFFEGLLTFCTTLFTSTSYQQANGSELSSIQLPDICLLDVAFWDLLCLIRNFAPKVPVLVLSFGNTTASISLIGPEELGGKGDVWAKGKVSAEKTGNPIDETIIELYLPNKGEVTNLIGLPKVYDYECYVKFSAQMVPVIGTYPNIFKLFRDCDGVITTSPRIFEPESNDAFRAHYEGSGRSYYVSGPIPPTLVDKPSLTGRDGVKTFLDRMLQEHGERSVLYVSFGSTFWPLNTEVVWRSFEIIHEAKIPMIIVHNDVWMRPPFPDSLRVKFEVSGIVLISEWAPQKLILRHKASYINQQFDEFVSFKIVISQGHCMVLNTLWTKQCIRISITRIAWPVEGDQIMNAMYIGGLKHNVGYELLEVLQRDESKPLYRGYTPSGTLDAIEKELRTTLQKAFGHDGAEKRRNAEGFKDKMRHLWDEDGDARLELKRFIKDYLS